ncbi:MAG: hypothetical protein AUJ20_09805 [Comamonadaceae bacterium CG1_02_60_18]|nr:MAG: hypothetical protein AUJ20_09805 [Comamonadaceae bacterium CG1_02_60_18]PIQ56436.1 MAG: hypothetical protein COW02_01000 [Comamonadaceae bacterium CG12_big_fil_rev_8_21_14_0_65_59_15]
MLQRIARLLRHRWMPDDAAERACPPAVLDKLTRQVATSETGHSGEIRIYIEAGLPLSYLWLRADTKTITRQRALSMFGKLRVWDTEHNNGVLIYLLLAERQIEIVADRGLAQRVSADTWPALVAQMSAAFQAGQFEAGLTQAVDAVNRLLRQHFALDPNAHNPNELPDRPLLG